VADSGGMAAVLEVVAAVSGGDSRAEDISADPIMMGPMMMTIPIMTTVRRMDSLSASAGMVGVGTAEIGTAGGGDNYTQSRHI